MRGFEGMRGRGCESCLLFCFLGVWIFQNPPFPVLFLEVSLTMLDEAW